MAGIYVHIPFCHSKCAYCDFFSTPRNAEEMRKAFIEALAREWHMRRNELADEPVKTIYLGGGTPSILSLAKLEEITSLFPNSDLEEFTIETNPEDVTDAWVAGIAKLGINRVSIGVQSLNDDELSIVGRRHTAEDALRAIACIKSGGISNISADLIYGLPKQTIDSWNDSLHRLLATGITHLSAYSLSYEQGTRLYAMLMNGKVDEAPQELSELMYTTLCSYTTEAGFEHYEISNFARPGMHSRHNSSYWDYTPYLGLGPGAHSFDGKVRRVNPAKLQQYINDMHAGKTFCYTEDETLTDRLNDAIITALRTSRGLQIDSIQALGGTHAADELRKNAAPYIASGRIEYTPDNVLRIPEKYWLISDAILRDLLLE
jgi:oxygen-independent coproporphyrinogen-3 oxidase